MKYIIFYIQGSGFRVRGRGLARGPVGQVAHSFTMTAEVPTMRPGVVGKPKPHQPKLAHCSAARISVPLPCGKRRSKAFSGSRTHSP
jgi:hypothetical protein